MSLKPFIQACSTIFRSRNTEWVILTLHDVRPDWMELDRERDINEELPALCTIHKTVRRGKQYCRGRRNGTIRTTLAKTHKAQFP